ncbi:MAG TPA: uridine kinase [Gammaproteobacteria bacterium]|nr:uridine kinase [Gammaproteobacteria bacterium]
MRKLFDDPLFAAGLLIRLLMLVLVLPQAALEWYVPFMKVTAGDLTLDPWHAWLASGGSEYAFPYGYVMWLIFLPMTYLCGLLGVDGYYGYGLTLLFADVALQGGLKALLDVRPRVLLATYWLSPIVLFATYWLGFNDLIPVAILCGALYSIRHLKPFYAGALCGAAVSAKLSMVLALPFFCMYLFRNPALRPLLSGYIKGLALMLALLCMPFALSDAGMQMLFRNPEMSKTYKFALIIGDDFKVYLLPMAYLLMLYIAWHMGRISFELFNVLLGIAFLLVVLLTAAAPGWFIWVTPLLIYYIAQGGQAGVLSVAGFTALYIASNFLSESQPLVAGTDVANRLALALGDILGERGLNLLHTAILAFGAVLIWRIWREAVSKNEYFRLRRKPFVIGIAGDSAAGKDSLVIALKDILGNHSVVQLSGDDYHLWDRHKPMWQVMTHLNPNANDLERYAEDLLDLADGKSIHARHYDHATGRMSHPVKVKSNEFIIASGLHSLHLPILRNCCDLKIYLDIDEGLRRHFKIQRDVHQRGHSIDKVMSSLEKREVDAAKFVRPQAEHADLLLSLKPIHPRVLKDPARNPLRFKLGIRSREGFHEQSLVRVLVGVCGLHVDVTIADESREVELVIEGETTGDDIALAARSLFPGMREFLDLTPRWRDGVEGLMQLAALSHINQALSKRLI